MSYLVLARKYRPRNFAEMVGQEHVVQALANATGKPVEVKATIGAGGTSAAT